MNARGELRGVVHLWRSTGPRSATGAVLLAALAEHMDLPPEQVPLRRDPSGRPVVGGAFGLEVSVSHTSDLVLVAVGFGQRVGVDIELVREGPWRLLPTHALADNELALFERCPPESRTSVLLRYWVRKEALLKAAGVGLVVDPRAVEVSSPDDSARVVSLPDGLGRPASWSLVDLDFAGYVAALAVEGARPRTVLRALVVEGIAPSQPSRAQPRSSADHTAGALPAVVSIPVSSASHVSPRKRAYCSPRRRSASLPGGSSTSP